jgi:hypothetical protein
VVVVLLVLLAVLLFVSSVAVWAIVMGDSF